VEVVASLSQGRTAAAQCGLFTYKSVPVIFEPPFTKTFVEQITEFSLQPVTLGFLVSWLCTSKWDSQKLWNCFRWNTDDFWLLEKNNSDFPFHFQVNLQIFILTLFTAHAKCLRSTFPLFIIYYYLLLRHCATSRKVAGSIPDGVTGIFHWQSFRPHYAPGVDSASNRNEYQEYSLGG